MRHRLVLLFFCFMVFQSFSQELKDIDINEINKGFRAPDSLMQMNYKELLYSLKNKTNPKVVADKVIYTTVIKSLIEKAKFEKDSLRVSKGYYALATIEDIDISYVDTCIYFSKNSKNKNQLIKCLHLKSWYDHKFGNYKESLKYALDAYDYSKQQKSEYNIHYSEYLINLLNGEWGDKRAAILWRKKMLDFIFSKKYTELYPTYNEKAKRLEYIRNIYSIAYGYLQLRDYNNSKKYIEEGIEKSRIWNFIDKKNSFRGLLAVYYYRIDQHQKALDSITKYINLNDPSHLYSHSASAVYKGLILNKLNRQEEAIAQIKYADSLYQITDDEFEKLTEGYKLLIDHYKVTGDETNQLMYLNKLLKLDSVITSNYITTNAAITKNYTIPELEREKEEAIARLEAKNEQAGWGLWALGSGLLLALGVGGYYFITQRQYKQRFKAVVAQSEQQKSKETVEPITSKPQENPLDPELVRRLDKAIKAFETEERFTATKITQKSLAEDLQTNSAYLSRYINQYKGKNFAQYLISLRINYAIQRLQKDKVLRSYTVDAIAEECGFGNSKSFTKAFKAATGINPSYFIRNIEKEYAA